jgi:hypothetical protein
MTFIGMAFGLAALGLGSLGFLQALGATPEGSRASAERELALAAARDVLHALRGEELGRVFARFNSDPHDDPAGPGSAPGAGFDVRGLAPSSRDADGRAGEIQFPTQRDRSGRLALREDLASYELGMPRDLDGDGAIDGRDHSADYGQLPVRIVVRWESAGAERAVEVRWLLVSGGAEPASD